MSSTPSYLVQNSYGVHIFQARTPQAILNANPNLKPLIRRSTRTKNRNEGLRIARRWMTELEDQWYGDIEVMGNEVKGSTLIITSDGNNNDTDTKSFEFKGKEDPTLASLVEKWMKAKARKAKIASMIDFKQTMKLFLTIMDELCNARTLSRLTVDNVIAFRDALYELPQNMSKKYPGVSIKKLIEIDHKKTLSLSTVHKHVMTVKNWLKWLEANNIFDSHKHVSVLNLVEKPKKNQKKQRKPWTEQDLKLLFTHPKLKRRRYSMRWTMLIALFTGMRSSEILSLTTDDIFEEGGIWCINLEGDLKTESSEGVIPIAAQLIELGFLDFVNSQPKGRLFPNELKNASGKYDAYSKLFNNYKRSIGIKVDTEVEFRDAHSFRHLLRTKLARLGVDTGLADSITRHESFKRSMGETTYTHYDYLKEKKKALDLLRFDFLKGLQV